MVEKLFPTTKNIGEVVGIIDKYRMKFGLNTGMISLVKNVAILDKSLSNVVL